MRAVLILASKILNLTGPLEPIARNLIARYRSYKLSRVLKKHRDLNRSLNQEYLSSLNQVVVNNFAELKTAKNIIVIADTSDVTSLTIMLKSLILTGGHLTSAILVNPQTHPDIMEKYRVYPIVGSPRNNLIQNVIDSIGQGSFKTLFYFQNSLVPLGNFLEECVAGSVYSGKILDLNQRVICAGKDFNSYGQIQNYHEGAPEFSPEVSYCRKVGAVDLKFLSISRELIESFLESYSVPIDLELAISHFLMQKGVKINYNPFAKFLRVQAPQPKLPSTKWDQNLSSHRFHCEIQSQMRQRSLQKHSVVRVVFVEVGIPKPDRDAASVTHLWYLRMMCELGFDIVYISAFSGHLEESYCETLYRMGIKVIRADSPVELQSRVKEELNTNAVLFVCRALIGSHLIPVVKKNSPEVKIIFNTVDLDFLRNERLAINTRDVSKLNESLITRFGELELVNLADETLVVSSFEQRLLSREFPSKSIRHVRLPYLISERRPSFRETNSVIFVGGFKHMPNHHAAIYLIGEIWPHVRELDPSINLRIVGSDIPNEILSLEDPLKGINILGFVPELDELIQTSRISVAPLLYGAGVKGKVLQSLSLGIPVIGTKIAAEGTGLIDGLTIIISKNPRDFARNIVNLYGNQERWEFLQENSMKFVKSEHSPDAILQLFDEILRNRLT